MKICQSIVTASQLFFVVLTINKIRTLSIEDKGVLPLFKNSAGLQFYIDVENENRLISCGVQSSHQRCCLAGPEQDNCSILEIYSPPNEIIEPRDRRTLLYVAPLISQHDIQGHCEFDLNYQCNKKQDSSHVIIPFDTRINKYTKKLLQDYLRNEQISACATIDQDPLDDCSPVVCDVKYLGHRLHYDNSFGCIDVPICTGDLDKELPDVVYVPDSNSCRNLDMPITIEDVYAITSGLGVVVQTAPEDDTYFEVKSNCSTISQNINLIRDIMHGKLNPCMEDKVVDLSECCKSAIITIILCIVSVTALLFSFICCVNTIVWLYKKWADGDIKKHWQGIQNRVKKKEKRKINSQTDAEVRNALLKDVIVKDIPMELRESVMNICDQMGQQVGGRRRYRQADVGSQISLMGGKTSNSTTESDSDE